MPFKTWRQNMILGNVHLVRGGGGGLQNGRGAQEVLPLRKGGGGGKSFGYADGGYNKFWGSFYAVSKSFGSAISHFIAPPPLPVINDQSLSMGRDSIPSKSKLIPCGQEEGVIRPSLRLHLFSIKVQEKLLLHFGYNRPLLHVYQSFEYEVMLLIHEIFIQDDTCNGI